MFPHPLLALACLFCAMCAALHFLKEDETALQVSRAVIDSRGSARRRTVVLSAPLSVVKPRAVRTCFIAFDHAGDAYAIKEQDLFAPRRSIASVDHSNPNITGCCRDGLLAKRGLPTIWILFLARFNEII